MQEHRREPPMVPRSRSLQRGSAGWQRGHLCLPVQDHTAGTPLAQFKRKTWIL